MTEKKSNLSQRTAEIIRDNINKEHLYKAGDKLPNENELSDELGVSRTTLREAIRILVSEGVLTVKRGKGTYVTNQFERIASGSIEIHEFSDSRVTLRDLYETRMIFEPEAASLACRRASDEEIKKILSLGDICQNHLLRNPTGKERIESEIAFHSSIIEASHNVFLSEFYNYPAIAVDTHVERVSKRLKLAYLNDDVLKIEKKLMKKIAKATITTKTLG